MTEFDTRLQASKDLTQLSNTIDKTNRELRMEFKREHKYTTAIYEEQLYKEVVYDTRQNTTEEEFKVSNPLKKTKKGAFFTSRNLTQTAKEAQELAEAPLHMRKPTPVEN